MKFDLLIRNTSEVLTLSGSAAEEAGEALGAVARGAVGIVGGRIAFVGPQSELPDGVEAGEILDAAGGFVGPAFIDPHTHLVFAGERAAEFDLRCQGASYLEIAASGGGIVSTVKATRAASEDELIALALPRLQRMLEQGVTCAEVKSGYGLSLEHERKMLRVVKRLSALQPVELLPTLLCAHAIPEERKNDRDRYVRECIEEIIPAIAEEKLARFCDAFVEQGAFSVEEGRSILRAASDHGMIPRLHADQLTPSGASELAEELGASSADHLEFVTDKGIAALARGGVSALLVPMSTLFLRMSQHAPGRKLRAAGINVALGTNVNPGSAMSENVGLTLSLACLLNGLTAAEAYWGMTRGAALALRREDLGQVVQGGRADLVMFGCSSYRHLPYHAGINHVRTVIAGGKQVHRTEGARCG